MSDPSDTGNRRPPEPGHLDEGRYLDLMRGLLPAAEREDLLAHLESCADCAGTFRQCASRYERLKASDTYRDLLNVKAAGSTADAGRRRGFRGFPRRWQLEFPLSRTSAWSGLAAAAVLLAILMVQFQSPRLIPLDEPVYIDVPTNLLTLRGEGRGEDVDHLVAGLAAYEDREFEEARGRLALVGPTSAEWTLAQVYLGSAHVWLNSNGEAVAVLSGLNIDTLPEPWRGEAWWALQTALRDGGAEARADSVLGLLAKSSPDSDAGQRAGRWLEDRGGKARVKPADMAE